MLSYSLQSCFSATSCFFDYSKQHCRSELLASKRTAGSNLNNEYAVNLFKRCYIYVMTMRALCAGVTTGGRARQRTCICQPLLRLGAADKRMWRTGGGEALWRETLRPLLSLQKCPWRTSKERQGDCITSTSSASATIAAIPQVQTTPSFFRVCLDCITAHT